jgi:dephospho-CoA kinase
MLPNIGVYGRSGAGKSTLANQLVAEFGYQLARPGAVCREITQRLFRADDKTTLNKVNDALRGIDPNIWLRVSLEDCRPDTPIVIDGLRFKSNLEFLRGAGFSLWKVEAPEETRRERLIGRGQAFDWSVDAEHAGETELDDERFDMVISNEAGFEALSDQVRRVLIARR